MTKYKEYFLKMLQENEEAFNAFREAHSAYEKDDSLQTEYNEVGKPIIELIREYEDRLCRRSESGGYSSYTGNLADKFWAEIRAEFPLIDRVGIIVTREELPDINLQKIELFSLQQIKLE